MLFGCITTTNKTESISWHNFSEMTLMAIHQWHNKYQQVCAVKLSVHGFFSFYLELEEKQTKKHDISRWSTSCLSIHLSIHHCPLLTRGLFLLRRHGYRPACPSSTSGAHSHTRALPVVCVDESAHQQSADSAHASTREPHFRWISLLPAPISVRPRLPLLSPITINLWWSVCRRLSSSIRHPADRLIMW